MKHRSKSLLNNGSKRIGSSSARKAKRMPFLAFAKDIVGDWSTFFVFVFVFVCFVLGGAPGSMNWQFAAIAVSGVALLMSAVLGGRLASFATLPLAVRLAVLATVALPFLQIVLLPPSIWQNLPGHELRIEILTEFGMANSWQPMSITPANSAYSAAIALLAFGLFITVLDLSVGAVRRVLGFITILVGLGTCVGIIQFATNGQALLFYETTHQGSLIGFFTNKNHMGLMLACAIPLLYIHVRQIFKNGQLVVLTFSVISVMILILLVATNSRAGLGLGVLAISLVSFHHFSNHRVRVALILGALILSTSIIAINIPVVRDLFERIEDTQTDLRGDMLEWSWPLLPQYALIGSGLGSFASVFAPTEQLGWVGPSYVNHVHNDFVQLLIEAGIPGVLVLVMWVLAIFHAVRFSPQRGPRDTARLLDDPLLRWFGLQVILFFAIHSAVDYPVRRVATLMLLTVALAVAFRPLRSVASKPHGGRTESARVIG